MRTIPNRVLTEATRGLARRYFRLLSLATLALTPALAHGASPTDDPGAAVPCAVLEEFDGDVQILDSERETLLKSAFHSPIPCGGWISVDRGWAEVRHRQGYRFRISGGSFAQFFDYSSGGRHQTGEAHMVLFRGSALAKVLGAGEELRVLTANGRVRMAWGRALVTYDPSMEETQVYGVAKGAILENRFSPSARAEVRAGEASNLTLGLARLAPSAPRAVGYVSARDRLAGLGLGEDEMKQALAAVTARGARKIASSLPQTGVKDSARPETAKSDYDRHRSAVARADAKLQSRGIASARPASEKTRATGTTMKLREIQTYDAWVRAREDREKERLIRELDGMDR